MTDARISQDGAAVPIIRRKVTRPLLPHLLVARPRLVLRIADAVAHSQMVTVTAAAGAGKTTAVTQALTDTSRPTAWLTLDRSDAAPGRLLDYLEAALTAVLPGVAGTVRRALAAGVPHSEVAGILVSAVEDTDVVLVLDELERLGTNVDAWAVIESLLRYAPDSLTVVTIARRNLPEHLCAWPPMIRISHVDERDLAFDLDEAERALTLLGVTGVSAVEALKATAGWAAGILFETWEQGRSASHRSAGDPMHGYLSAALLGDLSSELQDFLVTTSVLTDVTVERARALDAPAPEACFAELRTVRLPVVLDHAQLTMRCHPRFREYLGTLLTGRDAEQVRQLRRRHARLLAREGLNEEAATTLFQGDDAQHALPYVAACIIDVIERGDLELAQTWLSAVQGPDEQVAAPSVLLVADLMLAVAFDDFGHGRRVIERLEGAGLRDEVAQTWEQAAVMMGWCYLHEGRRAAFESVVRFVGSTPTGAALRYASTMITDGEETVVREPPELTGAPSDGLVLITHYTFGRTDSSAAVADSTWASLVSRSGRVATLRAHGRLSEALDEYGEAPAAGPGTLALHVYVGPELLVDAGAADRAREAADLGRRLAEKAGSVGYLALNGLARARLELVLERAPDAARRTLDEVARLIDGREFRHISGQLDTLYGLLALVEGDTATAVAKLTDAVDGKVRGHRLLELPTAAVYLSEALWRAEREDEADDAADLALRTAQATGSKQVLLQALQQFPAVISRRADAENGRDSPWHALGGVLLEDALRGAPVRSSSVVSMRLRDLGPPRLVLDGEVVKPRIAKSYELAALLSTVPRQSASRAELLEALFDGRTDERARTYLRQAVYHLRHVLPEAADLVVGEGRVGLRPRVHIDCDSIHLEHLLSEARRRGSAERLAATLDVLTRAEAGPYMDGATSTWIERRRDQLARQVVTARFEAAGLLFAADRFQEASELVARVLTDEPQHEPAWRLAMRIADALGDDRAVLEVYERCRGALADIDLFPAQTTRMLLDRLRG